jgi:hypothetical protein
MVVALTRTVESRAARATMSAQETVPGQAASRAALIWSTTSNPLREFMLGLDPFSLTMLLLLSRSTDASHPYTQKDAGKRLVIILGKYKQFKAQAHAVA